MLLEKLKQLNNPTTLKETFASNEQSVLYNRLTASLREAANGIKENMKSELKQISSELVNEAVRKIRIPRDGIDGKNAETPIKGIHYFDGEKGNDAVVDETRIIAEVIKQIPPVRIPKMRGGGDTIIADDLSAQCTGATRTFTTTKKVGKSLMVVSSQFPNVLRLTTDFTASGFTLTIDSAIPYIASGQTLYFLYSEG